MNNNGDFIRGTTNDVLKFRVTASGDVTAHDAYMNNLTTYNTHVNGVLNVDGGLNVRNVSEAIARLRPCAVDISSGVEITKGVKDPALIRAFIEAVRATDTPN